jgi:PhnB protein
MSDPGAPPRDQTVTLSLTVTPCAEAIEFYVQAFGAIEVGPRMTGPDGLVAHAELRIGNSVLMLGDEWPDGPTMSPRSLGGSTAAAFLYVDDVDSLWEQALSAGVEVVFPLDMQFYGDKGGRVRDPYGHTWGLAQHIEDVSAEEMERRMAQFYVED